MSLMKDNEVAFRIPQFAVTGPNHTFDPSRIAHLANNVSIIAMRFHKVGSSSFKNAISYVQPSHMDHDTLLAYRLGGLPGLRCLAAPAAPRVVFVTLFREPAARILSALFFYEGFTCGDRLDDSRRKRPAWANEELNFAHRWLRETPCGEYTAANVSRAMRGLSVVNISEELGGGMILDEYSHYFGVKRRADVAPTLAYMRRHFLVGTTEDMVALVDRILALVPSGGAARAKAAVMMRGELSARQKSGRARSGSGGIAGPAPSPGGANFANFTPPQSQPSQAGGPTPDGRASYCSSRDVPKRALADIARLAGHDVALYEGAKLIAAEQHRLFKQGELAAAVGEAPAAAHSQKWPTPSHDGRSKGGHTPEEGGLGEGEHGSSDRTAAPAVPVVEFNASYGNRRACRAGEGMRPGSYPPDDDEDDAAAGRGRHARRGIALYRVLVAALILGVVAVLGVMLKHEFMPDDVGQFSKLQQWEW